MALTKVKASNITLTTPAANSNDVTPATTEYVTTALANLVDSAPSTLNTLNELAAALGDDANYATTTTNAIAAKVALSGSGQTIADSGNLTLDVAGELIIDTDLQGTGNGILLKDAGTLYGSIFRSSSHLHLKAEAQDKNLLFLTNNGGSELTAMTIQSDGDVDVKSGNLYLTGSIDRRIKLSDSGIAGISDSNNTVHIRGDSDYMKLNAAGNGGFIFEENGSERFRINPTGSSKLTDTGIEVYNDIYSTSGSSRGAGYFRFLTDGSSAEQSVAQIYMEQGSGDGAARKCNMYFQVSDNGNPSTAMMIENNKVITTYGDFKPGADVQMNSGRGISFAATSNASTAGTSMGSELLDDYEEGTWAPTIIAGTTNPSGGSNLASNGHYVKVGRQVWVSYYAGVSWTNSPSGGVYVNRLPFPIANNNNNNSHPSATTYNFGTGTGESPFLSLQLNQTNARLYMMGPAGWGAADFASHVSSPLYITGQFTYFTT